MNRFGVLILVIGLLWLGHSCLGDDRDMAASLSGEGRNPEMDAIRFTDRAIFADHLRAYLEKKPRYLTNWKALTRLPEPPANSSEQTEAELRYLVRLQESRTPAQEAAVVREIKVAGMRLGPYDMSQVLGPQSTSPALKEVLMAAQHDMEIIVFHYKAQIDRARPTHLTNDLNPSIEVPPHPAYPSGHSTQAHLLAFLLAKIDPNQAEPIMADARQIARNREIAGVHFPSDSEVGKLLAKQIVEGLIELPAFLRLMEAARSEQGE